MPLGILVKYFISQELIKQLIKKWEGSVRTLKVFQKTEPHHSAL